MMYPNQNHQGPNDFQPYPPQADPNSLPGGGFPDYNEPNNQGILPPNDMYADQFMEGGPPLGVGPDQFGPQFMSAPFTNEDQRQEWYQS